MKPSARLHTRRHEGGAVAVETALVIVFLIVPLFAGILLFGKLFWHYTALQRAIHDASRYMAAAPMAEIRTGAAQVFAAKIVSMELGELDSTTTVQTYVNCGYRVSNNSFYMVFSSCSSATPSAVQAFVMVSFSDPLFSQFERLSAFSLILSSTMTYVGD